MSTMTVVLVHGNPETEAIWNPLVDALGRDDVVRVSPPGFGAPLPDDFPATCLAYRD
jgi:pimeloyl-ACP methyl ester carboxylesterase